MLFHDVIGAWYRHINEVFVSLDFKQKFLKIVSKIAEYDKPSNNPKIDFCENCICLNVKLF